MATAFFTSRKAGRQDNEWYTPPHIKIDLEAEFGPLTDPAQPGAVDGLIAPWTGAIFCNPPWGRGKILPWLQKGALEMDSGRVHLIIWLLPVATDTAWFHYYAWPRSSEVRFFRRRIKFLRPGALVVQQPSQAHMLVVWEKALERDLP